MSSLSKPDSVTSPLYHCQETLPSVMLSESARVAVTGKPIRGCRVERVDRSGLLHIGDLYRHRPARQSCPLVSVTFTVTSYKLSLRQNRQEILVVGCQP